MNDKFLLELKSKLDIVDIVSEYLVLQKMGSNYKARCPFHEEKTPSFVVSQEKQIFRCFGCGASGDIISFVSKIEGLSFVETLQKLAERAGLEFKTRSKKEYTSKNDEFYKITTLVKDFYFNNLKNNKKAKEYLLGREITEDLIDIFQLGYASPDWDNLYKHLLSKKVSFAKSEELGVLSKKTKGYYDVYRDRVIFPIINIYGQTLAFGGRVLNTEEKTAKYINSKTSIIYDKSDNLYGLFHTKQDIRKQGYAVVVEGYLDLIRVFGSGVRNVVATLGTAFTQKQANLLKRFTDTVVLLYDGDNAGVSAARKSLLMLLQSGFNVKVVFLEENMDPDEIIKLKGVEYLKALINKAKNFLNIIVNEEFKGAMMPNERAEALQRVLPYIASLNNKIEKSTWIEELSFKSKLSENKISKFVLDIEQEIKKQKDTGKTIKKAKRDFVNLRTISPMYKSFISNLIYEPSLVIDFYDNEYDLYVPNELTNFAKIIRDNLSTIKTGKNIFFSNLVHQVPLWVSELIGKELMSKKEVGGRRFASEFEALLNKFKIRFLEQKKQDYIAQLKTTESASLINEYRSLLKEIDRLKHL